MSAMYSIDIGPVCRDRDSLVLYGPPRRQCFVTIVIYEKLWKKVLDLYVIMQMVMLTRLYIYSRLHHNQLP